MTNHWQVGIVCLCSLLSLNAFSNAESRLEAAIKNPEYELKHWIDLPTSSQTTHSKKHHLSLREAILLALRYNPNIQNAELDRIIQRYQLRLAQNEFELQFALAGTAEVVKNRYSGIGDATRNNILATPEVGLKTKYGTDVQLSMDNTTSPMGNYNPLLSLTVTQPLLRGLSAAVNQAGLLNALDNEWLNKLNLKQSVIDQITKVIGAYRDLVLSGSTLESQKRQLQEASASFKVNEKKIAAGLLEPTANIQQSYQIESLSLMVEQAENNVKTTAQNLLQTIGLDPEMQISVSKDIHLDKTSLPKLSEAILQAENHNAQYLAFKMLIRADERAVTVAKNQQLWQLNATASVQGGTITGVDSQNAGFKGIYNGNNLTESAALTLTIPLRDISRRSELINAKVKLEKDRLNFIAARRALITLIKNTISTIQSQYKRVSLAERQVALAEKSYDLEKKKQQAGIASSLDVNNTQNQLLQAQIGLISAKIAYLNQLSSLQQILGTTLEAWHIKLRYTG